MNRSKLRNLIERKHGGLIYHQVWQSFLLIHNQFPFLMTAPEETYLTNHGDKQSLGIKWGAEDIDYVHIIIHDDETYDFTVKCDDCKFSGKNVDYKTLTSDDVLYHYFPRPILVKLIRTFCEPLQKLKFW